MHTAYTVTGGMVITSTLTTRSKESRIGAVTISTARIPAYATRRLARQRANPLWIAVPRIDWKDQFLEDCY